VKTLQRDIIIARQNVVVLAIPPPSKNQNFRQWSFITSPEMTDESKKELISVQNTDISDILAKIKELRK